MVYQAITGSLLKSTQMHFKTASFGEGTKKLWGCNNHLYIYNGHASGLIHHPYISKQAISESVTNLANAVLVDFKTLGFV